jgi:hypothetical protein
MNRFLIFLLLAVPLVGAKAQIPDPRHGEGPGRSLGPTLEQAAAAALGRDPTYAQRLAEVRKAVFSLDAVESPSPATLSLSSGSGKLSVPAGSGPILSLQPTVGVVLSEPWETNAALGVSASIDLEDPGLSTFKPSLNISQPLDRSIWGKAPDLDRAKLRSAVRDANEALEKRGNEIVAELYADIRALRNAEYSLAQARYDLEIARIALEEARATASYADGSASMAKLRLDLAAAESTLSKAERSAGYQKAALERLIGSPLEPLPLPPDPGILAVPGPEEADRARDVAAARRSHDLALLGYQIDYGPPVNSLAAEISAASAATDYGTGSWDYNARLAFGRGDLAFSLGGGSITRRDDTRIPYLSFKAEWKPENAAAKADAKAAAEAALQASAGAVTAALDQARASLETFAREASDLEADAALALERRGYADALLAEKTKARAAGIADDAELAEARWAREKLDYEADLARCDRAILELKIAAIFPQERQP